MLSIDLNVDLGEGFDNESLILPYISSCNIACGGHAGSAQEIAHVIDLAKQYEVAIGAHPSYPDMENFGRVKTNTPLNVLRQSLYTQIHLVYTIAFEKGTRITHVKPHGALYHETSINIEIANLLIEVILSIDKEIAIVGFPNGKLQTQANGRLQFIAEAFADRTYTEAGQLTPRNKKNATLSSNNDVAKQVLNIIQQQKVNSASGKTLDCKAQTICFHGDHEGSEKRIAFISEILKSEKIRVVSSY